MSAPDPAGTSPQGGSCGLLSAASTPPMTLRVVRPGVVLIAHGFQQQILTSSVIQRESAVIPAGVPLHRAGQRLALSIIPAAAAASRQKIERLLRFASAGHCCPPPSDRPPSSVMGFRLPAESAVSGASRSEGGRILPFCTLPGQDQPRVSPAEVGPVCPVGPSAPRSCSHESPSAGPRRRPVRLPWGRRCRRRSLRGRRGGCGLRLFALPPPSISRPRAVRCRSKHLPDVFHLSPPSTPGTAPDQSPGSPPPERGRVPSPPDGAAVFPSPRRSARSGPPRRREHRLPLAQAALCQHLGVAQQGAFQGSSASSRVPRQISSSRRAVGGRSSSSSSIMPWSRSAWRPPRSPSLPPWHSAGPLPEWRSTGSRCK